MVQSFNPTGSFSGILHTSLPACEFHCHTSHTISVNPHQPNMLTSELHTQKFSIIMNFQSKCKETIRVNKILLCSMNRRWPHRLITPQTYSLVRSEWRLSGYHALCSMDTFFHVKLHFWCQCHILHQTNHLKVVSLGKNTWILKPGETTQMARTQCLPGLLNL